MMVSVVNGRRPEAPPQDAAAGPHDLCQVVEVDAEGGASHKEPSKAAVGSKMLPMLVSPTPRFW